MSKRWAHALGVFFFATVSHAADVKPPAAPAPLDVARPMQWLLAAQNPSGGWGQEAKSPPDVATTALAGITLLRYGDTYAKGPHHEQLQKATEFVAAAVEKARPDSPAIQAESTQPQVKLGRYIDTYLAAQFLGEVLPTITDAKVHSRIATALDMAVGKVQQLQQKDGSFAGAGWAPVLSSAFATGGLYAAQKAGSEQVKKQVLDQAEKHMTGQYDAKKKAFVTDKSAGVELYTGAATLGQAAQSGKLDDPAVKAARVQVNNEAFLRGFGTYGGEEHVSYMMTSEALAKVGGDEWSRWDTSIRTRLAAIQRADGTWRGDHCITSTTFCTAASLITLAIKPSTGTGSGSR